jgi:hypothetical protein
MLIGIQLSNLAKFDRKEKTGVFKLDMCEPRDLSIWVSVHIKSPNISLDTVLIALQNHVHSPRISDCMPSLILNHFPTSRRLFHPMKTILMEWHRAQANKQREI